MTEQDAMNFIGNMYFKYFGSENDTGTYSDDVVDILNKITNSKIYEAGFVKNNWCILKDKKIIWDLVQLDVTSLYELLNKEILLFKLDLLNKE